MAVTEVNFECPTAVGEGARGGQLPLPMQGKNGITYSTHTSIPRCPGSSEHQDPGLHRPWGRGAGKGTPLDGPLLREARALWAAAWKAAGGGSGRPPGFSRRLGGVNAAGGAAEGDASRVASRSCRSRQCGGSRDRGRRVLVQRPPTPAC